MVQIGENLIAVGGFEPSNVILSHCEWVCSSFGIAPGNKPHA